MYIKQQYDKIDIEKKEITLDGNEMIVSRSTTPVVERVKNI